MGCHQELNTVHGVCLFLDPVEGVVLYYEHPSVSTLLPTLIEEPHLILH